MATWSASSAIASRITSVNNSITVTPLPTGGHDLEVHGMVADNIQAGPGIRVTPDPLGSEISMNIASFGSTVGIQYQPVSGGYNLEVPITSADSTVKVTPLGLGGGVDLSLPITSTDTSVIVTPRSQGGVNLSVPTAGVHSITAAPSSIPSGPVGIVLSGTGTNVIVDTGPDVPSLINYGAGIQNTQSNPAQTRRFPIITNTGVLSVRSGTVTSTGTGGVAVTGDYQNPSVNVTLPYFVTSVRAGSSNVTIGGTATAPTISVPAYVTSVTAGSSNVTVGGTAQAPTISVPAYVTSVAAGSSNVTIGGTAQAPTISVPAYVTSVTAQNGVKNAGTALSPILQLGTQYDTGAYSLNQLFTTGSTYTVVTTSTSFSVVAGSLYQILIPFNIQVTGNLPLDTNTSGMYLTLTASIGGIVGQWLFPLPNSLTSSTFSSSLVTALTYTKTCTATATAPLVLTGRITGGTSASQYTVIVGSNQAYAGTIVLNQLH